MTRLECSTLRCIAIISIVLHNFTHWLPGGSLENEFSFNFDYYMHFWNNVISPDFLIHVFSFWGHLGVPVFVFLTGYGLARKYDDNADLGWKSFLYRHWVKLFVPMLCGTLVYFIVLFALEGHLDCSASNVFLQCIMALNFISPADIEPMPYWYLGMTLQLYVIYLLFVYKRSTTILLLLAIASFIFIALNIRYLGFLRNNSVGWLFPFFMGVAYSRYQEVVHFERGSRLIVATCLSLLIILVCGFELYAWLLTPLFVVIFAVGIVKYVPVTIQQKMESIGRYSLYFMIVHPITRVLSMQSLSDFGGYLCLLLYILTTFLVVYSFIYIKSKL